MSRWFRMYDDVLDDPKVQRLPPDLFKAWVNLLCLASRNDGLLPGIEDIAFALRMSQDVTRDIVVTLSQRGLLDEQDGLSPHNWQQRQFKSDTAESAKERKRKQRAREKEAPKAENVTECHSDSHDEVTPPEQSRTEQNRTHTQDARVREADPDHWGEVQAILNDRSSGLSDWEVDFLHSVKWTETLTKPQREKLGVIRQRLNTKAEPTKELLSVKRSTPQFDAWIAHYRQKNGGRPTFHEGRDAITVPSEYPPREQVAA